MEECDDTTDFPKMPNLDRIDDDGTNKKALPSETVADALPQIPDITTRKDNVEMNSGSRDSGSISRNPGNAARQKRNSESQDSGSVSRTPGTSAKQEKGKTSSAVDSECRLKVEQLLSWLVEVTVDSPIETLERYHSVLHYCVHEHRRDADKTKMIKVWRGCAYC